jgi:hypothetical protein
MALFPSQVLFRIGILFTTVVEKCFFTWAKLILYQKILSIKGRGETLPRSRKCHTIFSNLVYKVKGPLNVHDIRQNLPF